MSNLRPIYCPKCFNHTCRLKVKGKVIILFNGKQMTSGQFIFNLEDQRIDQIQSLIKEKLKEYFEWYGNLKNKTPIKSIDLLSEDFKCESCSSDANLGKLSIIDILMTENMLRKIIDEYSSTYEVPLDY